MKLHTLPLILAAFLTMLFLGGCQDFVPEALQAEPPGPAPNTSMPQNSEAGQITKHTRGAFYSVLDDILDRGTLKLGVSPGFVPFVASGEAGMTVRKLAGEALPTQPREVVGFDIEIARAIADSLEVNLEVVTFDGIIPLLHGLKMGKVDLAMSGLTRTLERARHHFFSKPYYTSGLVLLVPKGLGYSRLKDLNRPTARLLVKPNTTAQSFVEQHLPEAKFFKAKNEVIMARLFNQGGQVAVVDAVKARGFALGNNLKVSARKLEGKRFTDEHFSIALPRDDAWRSYINIFLEDFEYSGKLDKLIAVFEPWLGKSTR